MRCPKCESDRSSVVDSRGDGATIRRRRECQACSYRFTTYERVELTLPVVVKKDGRREPFDRDKLLVGLTKACEKRPVSTQDIDRTTEHIQRQISQKCISEIPSLEIGRFMMAALQGLDDIAYMRFASVYLEFSELSQFEETLQRLKQSQKRPT